MIGMLTPKEEGDVVNHPDHYTEGGVEAIDVLEAKMSPMEFRAYLYGSVLKYVLRCKYKGKELEDLRKAMWYLNKLVGKHVAPQNKRSDMSVDCPGFFLDGDHDDP